MSFTRAIGDLNDPGSARVRRTSEEPRELAAGLVASCIRLTSDLRVRIAPLRRSLED